MCGRGVGVDQEARLAPAGSFTPYLPTLLPLLDDFLPQVPEKLRRSLVFSPEIGDPSPRPVDWRAARTERSERETLAAGLV